MDWIPISGVAKKKRPCDVKTPFSKNRANHRNEILKTWAIRFESSIEPTIPNDYNYPFDKDKCLYCLSNKLGPSGDECRPVTQRGRVNKINCVPCCGLCNSSKQDKCGSSLLEWIHKLQVDTAHKYKIIEWYKNNEKYMIIPDKTIDNKTGKRYVDMEAQLDERLNEIYIEFS
jgi:hypothetical protein